MTFNQIRGEIMNNLLKTNSKRLIKKYEQALNRINKEPVERCDEIFGEAHDYGKILYSRGYRALVHALSEIIINNRFNFSYLDN